MVSNRPAAALAAALLAFGAAEASASSIILDFEVGGLGYTPTDNGVVDANTFDDYNIRFVPGQTGLAFEATGDEGLSDPDGFLNDPTGQLDTERASAAGGLGGFFLRQVATLGGPQGFNGTDPVFSIQYLKTPDGHISGEIWDIDGNTSQGTESWTVTAFDAADNPLASMMSPVGTTTDDAANPLQAAPWTFAFDASSLAGIDSLGFFFTGTKTSGIGVAFDNFQTGVAPVPVPAALPLLLGGLGALGMIARRRRA